MVIEDKLSAVLSEFARTLVTDFPIQGILDHLVERIVEVLPVTGAGVTLISPGKAPRYIAASDESALRFERLQTEIGEGPCLSAHESGEAVAIADLATDRCFPLFSPAAEAVGLAAVFTFPLHSGDSSLGALDLYRDTTGDLDPHDMSAAQTLADVAAAYLLNAQARDDARATSDHFHHSALHDPLTGLPNRLALRQRLEHAAQRSQRSSTNAAILFADLDRFKQVNDTHGHHVGDELLLDVARRLSGLVRPGDTLARVSGDEFVFLCEDLNSADDVKLLARRIDESFSKPFMLAGVEVAVTASVGVAFAGHGEDISEQLMAKADTAMYQAKRKGGDGHQIIDLREALEATDRTSLERDLRTALMKGELDIAYQPIVRSEDGVVTGVEAFLRWTHPDRGLIPTMAVLEIAEQTGLIVDIGAWVLECGCRERVRWLHGHPGTPLDLAINISSRQLMTPDFFGAVVSVLDATGMDPSALVLEITERTFTEEGDIALTALAALKELGIRVALDDFGTRCSALSYLHRLPVDIVKIDQTFTIDIGNGTPGGAITAAVTNLAHVLGLTVTAEGVETQSQHDDIGRIGCDSAQGYFYALPMPAPEIDAYLDALETNPLHSAASRDSRPSVM